MRKKGEEKKQKGSRTTKRGKLKERAKGVGD